MYYNFYLLLGYYKIEYFFINRYNRDEKSFKRGSLDFWRETKSKDTHSK